MTIGAGETLIVPVATLALAQVPVTDITVDETAADTPAVGAAATVGGDVGTPVIIGQDLVTAGEEIRL